jgi:adenylate kinase
MAKKRTYLILFGAQGSGKGTQARLLQDKLGAPQVATGDLFRMHLSQGTELGKLAKSYMDRGELVPDSVTVSMVEERLSQPDAAKGAIMDGFPRNLAQAEALDAMLAKWNAGVSAALYIRLERDELMKRITGRRTCKNCQAVYHVLFSPPKVDGVCDRCGGEVIQRADDADEAAVARRLELYFEQTTPVIEYYRSKQVLKELDGSQSIEAVGKAMLAAIKPRAAAKKPVKKAPAKKAVKKPAKKATKKAPAKRAATRKTTRKPSSRK